MAFVTITKHQTLLLLSLFACIYFYLRSSIAISKNQFYLYRYEDVKFVRCEAHRHFREESDDFVYKFSNKTGNERRYDPCNDEYPKFKAFRIENRKLKHGDCWSSFDYIKGMSKHLSRLQKNVKDLTNDSCIDYRMRTFVNVDDTSTVLEERCESCALVFSSGRLIDSNYGATIDSHHCVIRMNNAPTRGFERDVGGRTTLRVVAHNALYDFRVGPDILSVISEKSEGSVVVWDPPLSGKISGKKSDRGRAPDLDIFDLSRNLSRFRPNVKVFYGRSEFFDNLWLEWTGTESNAFQNTTWISTGFYAFVIAMNTCKQTYVYGLTPENMCQSSWKYAPYHYYPSALFTIESMGDCYYFRKNHRRQGLKHLFFTEQNVFREWAKQRTNIHIVPIEN